jgi:CheY-like chemotaxis protein
VGLVTKPKILCLTNGDDLHQGALAGICDTCDLASVGTSLTDLLSRTGGPFEGIYISASCANRLCGLLQHEQILDGLPDGVVMLDAEQTITWANQRFRTWVRAGEIVGKGFYAVLGNPEIQGPDFTPFHTAMVTGLPSVSTLRVDDNRFFQAHAAPLLDADSRTVEHLIVTVRDITTEIQHKQKIESIHLAGVALSNLTPDEILRMTVDERIELLKDDILRYTQHLLHFDVVEIRLLDQQTGELAPLLSVGIDDEAAHRPLYARPQQNGVTGFVAATGKSYLCEDTTEDPLYLPSFQGAKSSLTVPLILHDEVIGTFNVESPEPRAFTENDLHFLEIFARDIAVALNTLELMVAQKASTALESVELIHGAVALPVDEILNDAVNVMECYIGHEPHVVERLQRILRNARDIKQVIQRVGQKMAPTEAVPLSVKQEKHLRLRGCRVLVVDSDESVRNSAHALLEKYGCDVETAHSYDEAFAMVRNTGPDATYNVIIADIRLDKDACGYDFFVRLKQILDPVPLILMAGFGYDPTHSIPRSRQAGLHPKAVLCKPFRLDQLIETVEFVADLNR